MRPKLKIANAPVWPNGARCAVAFSFDVDADSVIHVTHRERALDDQHALSHMRYDPFVATPRLVDLFDAYKVPMTCFVPGWVIERYPAASEYILKHGNEIAHHGYLHEWPSRQSLPEERRALEQGLSAIEKLTGSKPRGYRAPYYGLSRHSFDLLIEYGFHYDSSLFADDVPILLDNGKGQLIELPVPAAVDDYNQYVSSPAFDSLNTISPPARALAVFKAEFDALWELGGLWISVWHPGVSGRPAQALAIRDLIEHMQGKGDVWFATHQQVAEFVGDQMAKGLWQPRLETVPYYREPVLKSNPSTS